MTSNHFAQALRGEDATRRARRQGHAARALVHTRQRAAELRNRGVGVGRYLP